MRWFFKNNKTVRITRRRRVPFVKDLSYPLIRWSPRESWTLRNAYEGLLCLGATGSGKTSAVLEHVAASYLLVGMGGIILTCKVGDRQEWEARLRRYGRLRDLIVFGVNEPARFNFLQFAQELEGGAAYTENLLELFTNVFELVERQAATAGGRESERYWQLAMRQMLRAFIDLLLLAGLPVTIDNLHRILTSCATSRKEAASTEWQENAFCCKCMLQAEARNTTPEQAHDLGLVCDFLTLQWPALAPKTRSIVESSFTSLADALSRGILHQLLCTSTNITPQLTERGSIILIDLPIKRFGAISIICQAIWQFFFKWSIEQRNVRQNPRGVFLIGDEAQHFVTARDAQFQTTCRSSHVAVVWLGQNCPGFYEALGGGDKGRAVADALFANCCTKIFCANSCVVTNHWASALAGNTRKLFMNVSQQSPRGDWYSQLHGHPGDSVQIGMSEQLTPDLEPVEFSKLATGSRRNRGRVQTVVMQTGHVFADTGRIWRPHTFMQRSEGWWQF